MIRRTTIEIDEDLLARAKRALGLATTRATVEEALRRISESVEDTTAARADRQQDYLRRLPDRADISVLAGDEMWR